MPQLIAVNTRALSQSLTGVQRYVRELLPRLVNTRHIKPIRGMPGHCWEQCLLPFQLGGSLLFSPANTGPLLVSNQVVTIHDASTLDHPEWFSRSFSRWYRFLLPRLVRSAKRIITDSEYQRARLLHHAGLPPDSPHVVSIPLAVDDRFRLADQQQADEARRELGIQHRFVLAVGSLEPRKNLARLFAAWEMIRSTHPDCRLAIAGSTTSVFKGLGFDSIPPGVQMLGRVDDRLLPGLYRAADALAYPSLYEGFGLPPLEAMAAGTAVIASNTTSLPEVVGDAALTIDPMQVSEIADAMAEMLSNHDRRRHLAERGRIHASRFTWESTATRTMALLDQVRSSAA